ncbi:MAG: right-handed parallel beta-helix repeat-containing protein [Planctomycetota bacterium]
MIGCVEETKMPVEEKIVGDVFYVATNGNDAWSGKLASPNLTKTDGPFATLQKARDAIRALKIQNPKSKIPNGATVFVRGGAYFITEAMKFDAQDSGSADAPIVYRAYKDEKPIFIGGREIKSFAPHKGKILKTNVNGQGFKDIYFRQLFFDGKRQFLARYPNHDPANPYGGGFAYVDGEYIPMYKDVEGEPKNQLHYKAQDFHNWSRPEEGLVMVFPRYNWWNNICPIKSVDPEKRIFHLVTNASYAIRPTDRYYVMNIFEELDAPGEWYLDKRDGSLYFWPPAPIEDKAVYAPTTQTIIEMKDVSNVTLRGFTIECCEGTAVVLKDCTDCLIAGNTIRNVGDYGGNGVSVAGGASVGVVGNDIYEIGRSGISIAGGDRKTLTPSNHYADNNYIHHVGVFYKQGVGVNVNGVGNRVLHNYIHDGPRWGIGFGGCNNAVIEYNHIRHVNLETADTGAIYAGGRDWISCRGTAIRYNYFHDIIGFGWDNGKWRSPHYCWGIYLDDNCGGVDVYGNIVARTLRGLIHLHNGCDNHIENNIFVEGELQQVEYNGWGQEYNKKKDSHMDTMAKGFEEHANLPAWKNMRGMDVHPTKAIMMGGNKLMRNIIYYRGDNAKLFKFRNLPYDDYESDYNLIWHLGKPLLTGETKIKGVTGPNLAPNPGFEEGKPGDVPQGWQWQVRPNDSKAEIDTKVFHSGKQSARIEGRGTTSNGKQTLCPNFVSADIPAKPGQTYRLTAWLKAAKPGTKFAMMPQSYIANVYFWAKTVSLTLDTEWKEYEVVFKFPAPGDPEYKDQMKTMRIRLDIRQDVGDVWVDDVTLHEAEVLDEWESWKSLGFDQHSVVADPMFVNPEKDDYRLRPESPAFKLGFKPIPIENIGPYKDPLRASWPIVEAEGAREKPAVLRMEK